MTSIAAVRLSSCRKRRPLAEISLEVMLLDHLRDQTLVRMVQPVAEGQARGLPEFSAYPSVGCAAEEVESVLGPRGCTDLVAQWSVDGVPQI